MWLAGFGPSQPTGRSKRQTFNLPFFLVSRDERARGSRRTFGPTSRLSCSWRFALLRLFGLPNPFPPLSLFTCCSRRAPVASGLSLSSSSFFFFFFFLRRFFSVLWSKRAFLLSGRKKRNGDRGDDAVYRSFTKRIYISVYDVLFMCKIK